MKFLVVHYSGTKRRIIVNSLQQIGYSKTVEARDGQEALSLCDATIQFVITDWNTP